MKTKICFLTLILLIIFSCKQNCIPNDEAKKIEEFIEYSNNLEINETLKKDFCSIKEFSYDINKYNNKYGYAYFVIPVPVSRNGKTKLKFHKYDKETNTVEYKCNGDVFSNNIKFVPKFISGLNTGTGDEADYLKISVDYTSFNEEECQGEDKMSERKKGSTVPGEPQFMPISETVEK